MKNQKFKDQKRRRIYAEKELDFFVFKASKFISSPKTTGRKMNKCRIVNRCVSTYRDRAVFQKFRLTRSYLRSLLSSSKIAGFYKSSW